MWLWHVFQCDTLADRLEQKEESASHSQGSASDVELCCAGEVSQAGGCALHMPGPAGPSGRQSQQPPFRPRRLLQQQGARLTSASPSNFLFLACSLYISPTESLWDCPLR